MTPKDLVGWFYANNPYRPIKAWGRDCKHAKSWLEAGRTAEEFQDLCLRGWKLGGEIGAACGAGVHAFISVSHKINPGETLRLSEEERKANIKFVETLTQEAASRIKKEPLWAEKLRARGEFYGGFYR